MTNCSIVETFESFRMCWGCKAVRKVKTFRWSDGTLGWTNCTDCIENNKRKRDR